MRRNALLFAACLAASCAPSKYLVSSPPAEPFDAVIIPGCPSKDDGSPSFCQLGRAGQAALLWKHGWTRNFIVSGSDVHTPYVEAEAIAQAMTVLGVPPDRIILERDALHSDENVYYSLRAAEKLGLERLAIATNEPIASFMCDLMTSWGHACAAIDMDVGALRKMMPPYDAELHALRAPRSPHWTPFALRDRSGRPPSFVYYPLYRWLGHPPPPPLHPDPITWEERLSQRRE